MLQAGGFIVEVAAFHRREETLSRIPDCKITKLGNLSHGNYFLRILKFPTVIPRLRRLIKSNDAVYAFGPDMACLAILSGIGLGKPVCLDVADIRKIQVSRTWKGKLVRLIDRFVAKRCKLLVASAEGFVDGYYRKRVGVQSNSLIIENKLEPEMATSIQGIESDVERQEPISRKQISIGYFGILRCPWSLGVLKKLALENPDTFEVVLAGESQLDDDLNQLDAEIPNFRYLGPYKSPVDLPRLYSQIDLMWACYPPPANGDPDWWWAQAICRSNRFYECCLFRTPLLATAQSGDGIEIAKMNIGRVFDTYDANKLLADLAGSLTQQNLSRWKRVMDTMPPSTYQYSNEGEQLAKAIIALMK